MMFMLMFVFVTVRMLMAVVVMMVVIMMMRMTVVVAMIVIMVFGQMHIELHACDAGFFPARDMEVIIAQAQFLQLMLELMRIDAQVQQRGHEHIAADAAENIEVKRLHRSREIYLSVNALICAAAYPAPKPLSIFTTVTPLPQLFNMPSNAARPPKLAP